MSNRQNKQGKGAEHAKSLPSIKNVKSNQYRVGGIVVSVEQCGVKNKAVIQKKVNKNQKRSKHTHNSLAERSLE